MMLLTSLGIHNRFLLDHKYDRTDIIKTATKLPKHFIVERTKPAKEP